MEGLKEKLIGTLGIFGVVIYQLVMIAYAFLPFLVVSSYYIGSTWLIIALFIAFYLFCTVFPVAGGIANLILWVWGMVIAIIIGPLWFTILYAVFLVITIVLFVFRLRSNSDE